MTARRIHLNNLLYLFYLFFLVSMVGAFRAVSSIMIGAILAVSFIKNKADQGIWFNRCTKDWFLVACSLFFLLQLIPLAYTGDFHEGWKHVQVKSALLFIPLIFFSCAFIHKMNFHSLMIAYIYISATFITWCLGVAGVKYLFLHEPVTVFFYHQLVSNLGHHAVQFSIVVFAGLLYLLNLTSRQIYLRSKNLHFSLIAYFIIAILLLSSKLVIIFTLIYLAFYLFKLLQKKISTRSAVTIATIAGVAGISCLLFTQNPVSRRFKDILHGNIAVVQQPSFNRADYFNGVQFRLLQWRFVKEILQENKAWLFGVTPAGAQALLNQKYLATHMYTGVPGSADHGFLGYNTHNQFLEALLQTGIVGLLCFMVICFQMAMMAVKQKNWLLGTLLLLLFAYACSDSVFETQYGLVIFTFLPLLFYTGQSGKYPPAPSATGA